MLSKKKFVEIEELKAALQQTVWPHMTYMLIPSILEKAESIIKELVNYDIPEIVKLREELIELKQNFKRESTGQKNEEE